MSANEPQRRAGFWRSKTGIALCGFIAIAALLLILEHRAHALQWLPFAHPQSARDWRSFGDEYRRYRDAVPVFLPRFGVSTLTFPR